MRIRRLGGALLGGVAMACALGCARLQWGARPDSTLGALSVDPAVKFVDANDLRFAYLEEGEGPLVLLLHGYPETARSWRPVQQKLAAAGYRVVAPFMRGYPPTELARDCSVKTLGRDVLALIEALGEQRAIVVGHDWGATAAYQAAAESPSRLSRLVALSFPHSRGYAGDPSVFFEAPHFVSYQLPWAERLLWSHDFAHIERTYRDWSPGFEPGPDTLADVKASLRVPGATENVLRYYRALLEVDRAETMRAAQQTISVPTLVIAGDEDVPARLTRYERARPAFIGAYELVVMKGVGHFPQLEAPDATATAILTFLRSDSEVGTNGQVSGIRR